MIRFPKRQGGFVRCLRTALCDRLGIDLPIVQAPVGSAAGPELVAAVSEAGGLGMLALTWHTPEQARRSIRRTQELTTRPFGANLVLDFPVDDLLTVCLDEGVPIISTFWGDPSRMTARIRGAGALHLHTVGEVAEAVHAVAGGVDVVVAQGWEAGGHVRGGTTTLALVPAVVDAVGPIPVVAAGGIADGRGIAAVLALGAQGAMLGTRFLATVEAVTHEVYRQHLVTATGVETVYTRCFDGGWPHAPHRALRNATLRGWEAAGEPVAPHRPGEGDVVAVDAAGQHHCRYEDQIPLPGMIGDLGDMALYAGQSVNLIHDVLPAARLVHDMAEETATTVGRLHSLGRDDPAAPAGRGSGGLHSSSTCRRPMHKLVVLYLEPADPDHFRDYYVTNHLPLVTRMPGLLAWRYSFDVAATPGQTPYFAIFEADFADAAAMTAARASPQGREAAADVANYATGGAVVIHYPVQHGTE